MRSFVEPVGLLPSSLAHSRTSAAGDIAGSPTSGVFPIACRMSSARVTLGSIPARVPRPACSGPTEGRRLRPVEPETRYAKTVDGVHIAYQVRGDGPIDLV